MFIRADEPSDLDGFEPDFTVINACSQVDEDWKKHGLNSEVAVVFNIEKKCAVIFGTWYGGENKKGIFSLMNYWLPLQNPPQFPMHCSANVGKNGDSALFFGLSGTGKTTLSADPHRALIGDDEHGWDEDGVFNFEGGCYAKTINLSEKTEPDIYRAIHKDAMLENVALKEEGGKLVPDYFDTSKTENGRVSYPIHHIDNYVSCCFAIERENSLHMHSSFLTQTYDTVEYYSIGPRWQDIPIILSSSLVMPLVYCRLLQNSLQSKQCIISSQATLPRSQGQSEVLPSLRQRSAHVSVLLSLPFTPHDMQSYSRTSSRSTRHRHGL